MQLKNNGLFIAKGSLIKIKCLGVGEVAEIDWSSNTVVLWFDRKTTRMPIVYFRWTNIKTFKSLGMGLLRGLSNE